jgi:hypothetical protein
MIPEKARPCVPSHMGWLTQLHHQQPRTEARRLLKDHDHFYFTHLQSPHTAIDAMYELGRRECCLNADKYGKYLWTPGVDRSHLLQAGEVEAYAKDLNCKDGNDRYMLHLHLQQWIFAKAFANYRKSRAADKKGIRASITVDQQKLSEESAPIEQGTTDPQVSQRVTQGSNKIKSSTRKRKATSKSPPPDQPHAKVQRSSNREAHGLAAQALTTAMLAYIKLAEDDSSNEADLLDHIEVQTAAYAPIVTYPFPQAMSPWLTYRRVILAVREQASTRLSPDISEVRNKIMRARLLTDLRFARDAFVAMRIAGGLDCEEYICWALEKMAEGVGEWAGTGRVGVHGLTRWYETAEMGRGRSAHSTTSLRRLAGKGLFGYM